ncbi:MAG: phosphomannomutase [Pseudomonadota bacterium]
MNQTSTTLGTILAGSSVKFGTSGLRGLVADLESHLVDAATRAFLASGLAGVSGSTVFIARDLRPSSPDISAVVHRAIVEAGFIATDCGPVPTPALALAAQEAAAAAIMVTGSHIPFDRNGIKFYASTGEITKGDEAAILNQPIEGHYAYASRADVSMSDGHEHAQTLYIERATLLFAGLLTGQRVGVYQHSAVGRDLTVALLEALGATVIPLGRSDTFVPIDTEAIAEEDHRQCALWVTEHDLDALVTTDGDGDRPLLGDDEGRYFRGDELGILAARYLRADTVVTPATSISSVETVGWFDRVARTRVGSPYVLAAMEKSDADRTVGFEANGGFLVQNDMTIENGTLARLATRDAILPVLSCFAFARELERPLSGLRDLLPARNLQSSCLRDVAAERSAALASKLKDASQGESFFADMTLPYQLDLSDGLRFSFSDGEIVHIRPSGNAPELRLYIEADTAIRTSEVTDKIAARLEETLSDLG